MIQAIWRHQICQPCSGTMQSAPQGTYCVLRPWSQDDGELLLKEMQYPELLLRERERETDCPVGIGYSKPVNTQSLASCIAEPGDLPRNKRGFNLKAKGVTQLRFATATNWWSPFLCIGGVICSCKLLRTKKERFSIINAVALSRSFSQLHRSQTIKKESGGKSGRGKKKSGDRL